MVLVGSGSSVSGAGLCLLVHPSALAGSGNPSLHVDLNSRDGAAGLGAGQKKAPLAGSQLLLAFLCSSELAPGAEGANPDRF